MKNFKFLIVLSIVSVSSCLAQPIWVVFDTTGNLIISYKDGDRKQVAQSKMDCNPILSPDKSVIAFQRKTMKPNKKELCWFWNPQIWMYDIKSEKTELLVDTTGFMPDPKKTLMDLRNLQFSPDGKYLYFCSAAWETSESIHCVNLGTAEEKFITDGNGMQIIPGGKYLGHLIVRKHRYHPEGGSYDHLWLVNPSGEVLDSLGANMDVAHEFLKINN